MIVCGACGKVKGEHSGWDSSCDTWQVEVDPDTVERESAGGRVMKASAVQKADS